MYKYREREHFVQITEVELLLQGAAERELVQRAGLPWNCWGGADRRASQPS